MEQGPARACWMINACCVVQRRLVQTSLGSPVMTVSSARGGWHNRTARKDASALSMQALRIRGDRGSQSGLII